MLKILSMHSRAGIIMPLQNQILKYTCFNELALWTEHLATIIPCSKAHVTQKFLPQFKYVPTTAFALSDMHLTTTKTAL